jgi:hypothetical protein
MISEADGEGPPSVFAAGERGHVRSGRALVCMSHNLLKLHGPLLHG